MAPKAAIKGRKDSSPSNSSAFKHEDLDYRRGAIRLIRILPQLSKTGLIQCQIWHDNVGAKYDCLSYVWGSESNQKQILINGKTHMVRENLWDFMRVARKKYASPPRTFWIDALCINQGSIPERNHQVAQMGSIYSNAGHVLAWLGLSENISRAFRFGLEMYARHGFSWSVVFSPRLFALEDWFDDYQRKWVDRNMQTDMQLKKDWFSVVRNPYWTRAWITQEIYLARNITMLVNDLEVEPKHIANVALGLIFYINDLPGHPTVSQGYDNSALVFATYIKTMCQDPNRPRTQKLVSLLGQLPGRQSLLIHDRVYSLLSIASDTSSITVDYRCSKDTLLRQLLGVYKTSMCICSWFYMVDMLDCRLEPDPKNKIKHQIPVFKLPMEIVEPEFIMAAKESDWHYKCPSCQTRMLNFDQSVQRSFCIKAVCENVQVGHLYLHQRPSRVRGGRPVYTLVRHDGARQVDVLNVESGFPRRSKGDIDHGWAVTPSEWHVYFTVDMLMQLFGYPEKREPIRRVPLTICKKAEVGKGRMEFCDSLSSRAR